MNGRPSIVSFCAHRGGTGRSAVCVMTAEAVAIYGDNVAIVDFDFEAPGLLAMSTLKRPNPMFQPDNLFDISQNGRSLLDSINNADEVEIPGLALASLVFLDRRAGIVTNLEEAMREFLRELPIYEVRPKIANPLEGRMFVVPLGGKFKKVNTDTESIDTASDRMRTEWAYRPTSLRNGDGAFERIIHSGQIGHIIQFFGEHKLNFFDLLARGIQNRIDEQIEAASSGQEWSVPGLNYIFFDQRPGFSGRTVRGASSSDGVVMVGLPSRSGAIGVASQFDDFRRAEELYRNQHDGQSGAGSGPESRVLGVVLNALPTEIVSDAKESGLEAIKTNILESGLLDRLSDAKNGEYLALQKERESSYYRQNFYLLAHRYRSESGPFAEESEAESSGSTSNQTRTAAEPLWRSLGFGSNQLEQIPLANVIPLGFEMNMRLFDISIDFRQPYAIQNRRTSKGIADAIMLLAGHILDSCPTKNDKATVRVWLNNLRNGSANAKETPSIPDGIEKTLPWREHLLWVLGKAWGEKTPAVLTHLVDELDIIAKKQIAFVESQIGGDSFGWKEDWRILALKGDLLSIAGEPGRAEESYRLALQSVENWAKRLTPNQAADTQQSDDFLMQPVTMVEASDLNRILTDISASRARNLADLERWPDAWRAFQQAFRDITLGRRLSLIDSVRDFLSNWQTSGGDRAELKRAINELVEGEIRSDMENPSYGIAYKKRFADLSDMAFWIDPHVYSEDERKKALSEIIDSADAWLKAVDTEKLQSSEKEIARLNAILGRSKLVLSFSQSDANSTQSVREALEHLERSVNLDEENIVYHAELAHVQEAAVCQMWAKLESYSDVDSKDKDQLLELEDLKLEQSINQRSAFYSFEQTFALLIKPEDQDFFFDSTDADALSESLLETLSAFGIMVEKNPEMNQDLLQVLDRIRYLIARISDFRANTGYETVGVALNSSLVAETATRLIQIFEDNRTRLSEAEVPT